jgi:hypothetical protein
MPEEIRAKVPVELPMAVLAVPVVLMLAAPAKVAPAVAVNNPFNVRESVSAAGNRVVPILDQ